MSVLLRTEDVRKAYGGVHALDSCTVEIEEGSVAGLIGPNGSGKTTLFNVITGYAKADAGPSAARTRRAAAAPRRRGHASRSQRSAREGGQ